MCANWTAAETTELLSIRAEAEIVLSGTVRDAVVYEQIKNKMEQRGFSRGKSQIISKLKSLRKKFHQVLDHNGKSGSGRLDWPFYDLCYNIWGTSHSAKPVALLGSMDLSSRRSEEHESSEEQANSAVVAAPCTVVSTVSSSPEAVEDMYRQSNSESPQPPPAKKARKRQSRSDFIVKEVKEFFFEMDRDFEERERVRLEEQREYEKRLRREASQAREEELAKQMAMLRELQETQNHFLGEILCRMPAPAPCQNHLEQHETFFRGKRHNLMDATGQLQEMICPQHENLLEIYCRTDQQCICYPCTMDEHKNHETVSAAAERTEKQRQLGEMQRKYQQRIQERQKELDELRETVESHKRSAQAAVEDSERIFTDLISSIKRSRSEVTQLIRDQEKAAVSRSEEQLKRLEQETEDLRRRNAELEQLSHADDHILFLQSFQSLSVPPGSTDSPSITVSSCLSFDDVGKTLSHLSKKLEHICREEIEKIAGRETYIEIIPTSEPKTREEFLQYSHHQLTLDLNTVNKKLHLSEMNRVIEYADTVHLYPDHPDRFDYWEQVLCRESVCGRCYWEVEWTGEVDISVSYKSISRKGQADECRFGCNDQSWCLSCSDYSCSFWHSHKGTKLPVVSSSSRIGVYVDHSAGTLSFYSVSDTMTLIHRVQTTFTQPLYAGFEFSPVCNSVSKVKLCKL